MHLILLIGVTETKYLLVSKFVHKISVRTIHIESDIIIIIFYIQYMPPNLSIIIVNPFTGSHHFILPNNIPKRFFLKLFRLDNL